MRRQDWTRRPGWRASRWTFIGRTKFSYDVWGDAVNTASRMEQHGEAGKINISEATYELVKDRFDCEYRGEIEAKNKGKLKMYFVEHSIM